MNGELGDRIVAAVPIEWMTPREAPKAQPQAMHRPVLFNCFNDILRT